MTDDYLHSWKSERGYYEFIPDWPCFRWYSDEECDIAEIHYRDWKKSLQDMPKTEYGWKKDFCLLKKEDHPRYDRDRVRERVDFARVLELYGVKFKRRGDRGMALCPFHNEKTASFSIDFRNKRWYCHSEAKGGDIFAFLMEKNDITFYEALKEAAQLI